MTAILDRFEEHFAVLELSDGTLREVCKSDLPPNAKEGDVLVLGEPITLDQSATHRRAKKIKDLMDSLFE